MYLTRLTHVVHANRPPNSVTKHAGWFDGPAFRLILRFSLTIWVVTSRLILPTNKFV